MLDKEFVYTVYSNRTYTTTHVDNPTTTSNRGLYGDKLYCALGILKSFTAEITRGE